MDRRRIWYPARPTSIATMMASAGSAHAKPARARARPVSTPSVMKTSVRVWSASARRMSLLSRRPARVSNQTTADVHGQGEHQERQCDVGHVHQRHPGNQAGDGAANQLENRERQQECDEESTERLELGVPIGMILVGRLRGHPNDEQGEEIVDGIHRGLERVTEHRQ